MKKYLLLICILFQTIASAQTYSFSKVNEAYNDLVDPVAISGTALWTNMSTFRNIPLGFTFPFYSQSVTQMHVHANGFVDLPNFNYAVNFFLCNMKAKGTVSNSLSPVSYKVEGQAVARIFKLQFKNAGFINSATDFVNVQLWLYESSGRIEIRFGPSIVTHTTSYVAPYSGPLVSLENWTTNDVYYLKGNPANPSLTNAENNINAVPANGTVYSFRNIAREPVGFDEPNPVNVRVFPNPGSGQFKLEMAEVPEEISITDVRGALLYYSTAAINEFDISNLQNGLYLLRVKTKNGLAYQRIVKQ